MRPCIVLLRADKLDTSVHSCLPTASALARSVLESYSLCFPKMSIEIGKVATVELIRELEKRLRCSEIKSGSEKYVKFCLHKS